MCSMIRPWIMVGLLLAILGIPAPAQVTAASWRVGLQAGHWRSHELPEELKRLRTSTGATAAGYQEYQINLDVAYRTAFYLRNAGIVVDILPATVPPAYRAHAFVALHADGNGNTGLSGFKAAAHWREWEASVALVAALRQEYGAASGLPWDAGHITRGMRGYYALSSGRYDHTIANSTPGAILEMGYLTNARDRYLMTQQADRLAQGIANGILHFLSSEPDGGWPAPSPLPEFRATVLVSRANIRSGPSLQAPIVRTVERGRTMLAAGVEGSWVKLVSYRHRGERWIYRDLVQLIRIHEEPQDH